MDGESGLVNATLYLSIATLIGAIISAVVVWITAKRTEKRLKEQLKQREGQHQVQGLLEAFRALDKESHREYRKIVFHAYFIYYNFGDVEIFRKPEYSNAVANVMADFDIMGKLVESGNIDRKQFLEEYGSLVYRCWKLLEHHVMHERELRKFPHFMTWFKWLAEEGYKYWKDERQPKTYDLDDTVLFDADNPEQQISFRKLRELKRSPA